MAALEQLSEEEEALWWILSDPTGVDQAEFLWRDDELSEDGCYRLWDFQWPWSHPESSYTIDQLARQLGKSISAGWDAMVHVFNHPGQDLLLTAPELSHLSPLIDKVKSIFDSYWLLDQMRTQKGNKGVKQSPHWEMTFLNGAKIVSRLPQRDGKGVKGCVGEGTMVLTKRGMVPVEEVVEGDLVYTHMHRWRPVLATYRYSEVDGVEVAGGGHRGLVMSDNHRMLARRNRNPRKARQLESETWLIPGGDEEVERYYLGSPVHFPAEDAPWARFDEHMARVVGRYVADGIVNWGTKPGGRLTASGERTSARLHIITAADRTAPVVEMCEAAGLRPSVHPTETGARVEVSDTELCRFVEEHFGKLSHAKSIPPWLLGAPEKVRRAFLEGYLSGDGHWEPGRERWTAGTASRALAVGLRLLGQTLGWSCSLSWVDPKVTHVQGVPLKRAPRRSWRVTLSRRGHALVEGSSAWQKIRKVEPVGIARVYDLAVEEDHSYLADGLYSHNQHPIKIVHDEVQDYPIAGYMELVETIKTHLDGAGWKMHGVSKGVGRDLHYQITQGKLSGDSDVSFQTLHYTAMHRPTWSDDERRRKIKQYGGDENHPDYVRNIYGLPSEAGSTIFVTARLMAAVDHEDVYNDEIYAYLQISGELIERTGEVERLLDLPLAHISERYTSFWGGMDVGFTHDPSEILIFGSERDAKRDRLLSRVRLERVTAGDQVRVVKALFAFYGEKLKRFGMDRTGNGLPLWHLLQEDRDIAERVAGYNFSEKRPVEIDETSDAPELEDRLIKRNIKDYGVDVLRTWVDDKKLVLPFDQELLGEWQGATAYIVKSSPTDDGPVRKYGGGDLHTLDAARMYAAAKNLLALETLLAQEPEQESVYEEFL